MKKTLLSICLACTVFGTISPSVDANVIGGWSEEEGYFTSDTSNITSEFATRASKPTHKGYKELRGIVGSQQYERAVAKTTWKGVHHFSRARYVTWVGKKTEADSGRVFGTGFTSAYSGWHPGDFATATTNYGTK